MDLFVAYAVLGGVVLALALFAAAIKQRMWTSEPLLAVAVGVPVGPYGRWN